MTTSEDTNQATSPKISIKELLEADPERTFEMLSSLTRPEIVAVMSQLTDEQYADVVVKLNVASLNRNALEFQKKYEEYQTRQSTQG